MSPLANLSSAQWAGPHHSIDNLTGGWITWQGSTSTIAWGTQYRAIYVPVRVPRRVVVRELGYVNGSTATGNYDIGLYDAAGTRLASSGSTAKTTTAAVITYDVSPDVTIGPGLYYLALNNDTTTDTFTGMSDSAPNPAGHGILTETLGSVALPATATWVVPQTLTFIPLVSALLVTEVS